MFKSHRQLLLSFTHILRASAPLSMGWTIGFLQKDGTLTRITTTRHARLQRLFLRSVYR